MQKIEKMIVTSRPVNLVILFICFIPFLFLGIFDLDEGAFAATSLQMIKDGQYLIPYIGEELRLEKPILSYWIQALFLTIFGFVSSNSLEEIFRINAIVPILWLSELINYLSNTSPSVVAVLSARVGSITDNKLGGWYSYRASKSALNMLLKTAAIEYSRGNQMVKLLSLHPGTVDTKLSKPFQRSIPKEQIFTPDYAASRLLKIMKSISHDGELDYLDWEGKEMPW